MMRVHCLKLFVALAALLIASPVAFAQERQANLAEVFAPVNAALRSRLAERLKLYVEYERNEQWEKLFALTSKQYLENDSRDEFVKRRKFFDTKGSSDIIDFVPQYSVTSYYGIEGNYSIYGCMKVRWKGRVHRWHGALDAYWEKDDWYFSTISVVTGIDAPPQPCVRNKKRK